MKYLYLFLILLILPPINFSSADDSLSVQVKETKLRSAPRQWASSISSLQYGDTIVPIKIENDWVEGIADSKKKGFVHISAMSSKKVILSSGKVPKGTVNASDVVLAGKGFSKATEDEYAKINSGSNFQAVNVVETLKVPESELLAFLKDGQLAQGGK
jgi:hypothetical protein